MHALLPNVVLIGTVLFLRTLLGRVVLPWQFAFHSRVRTSQGKYSYNVTMMMISMHRERWRRRLILASIATAVISSLLLVSTWTDGYNEQIHPPAINMGAGHRGLAQYTEDTKSITPRPPSLISDGDNGNIRGHIRVASSSRGGTARPVANFETIIKHLKQSENLWLRGRFAWKGRGYHANDKGREEQIASALATLQELEVRVVLIKT